MYPGFKFRIKPSPTTVWEITQVNPITVSDGIREFRRTDLTIKDMREFVNQGHWIPELPSSTEILQSLKRTWKK